MPKKKLNKNHELDLKYLQKHGKLENSEIKLSGKQFLTKEKIEKGLDIYANLFVKELKNR
jgi:hypothetical protein